MFFLDTLTDITIYRLALILKYGLNIVFIVIPLITIVMCSIDIFKHVINPSDTSKSLKTVVTRLIAGLIVFLLPNVIDYSFTLIDNYNNATIVHYYTEASVEKIKQLEAQHEQEIEARRNMTQAEIKEAALKDAEEARKRNEQLEILREEYRQEQEAQNNQNNGNTSSGDSSYTGDSVSSGTFGGVTVNNGVFNIPNQRATSDADTPKQSGEYGLNPVFWERLSKLINDAAAQGYTITVTSGWRSYSSQRRLWDQSSYDCSIRNKWVACPGGSRHGFGIAADLAFNGTGCSGGWDCNAAAAWVHANAANYGLRFPMSYEAWHIEPAQITGGQYGACTATC